MSPSSEVAEELEGLLESRRDKKLKKDGIRTPSAVRRLRQEAKNVEKMIMSSSRANNLSGTALFK